MRTIRLAPVLAAVALLAACSSNPLQPSSQGESRRNMGGGYIGTGASFEPITPASAAGDSSAVSRGSGYAGSGH